MKAITFATTNQAKIQNAQAVCEGLGIEIVVTSLDIDEIQGEDAELIVRDKAHRAYEQLGAPVVVSDDSWDISALNGFPGPYMKSINHWFGAGDLLRLMTGVQDRRITLHQYLAYTDGNITEVFKNDITGKILHEARGINHRAPHTTIVELDSDNGKTIAEVEAQDAETLAIRYKSQTDAWHGLVEWYVTL